MRTKDNSGFNPDCHHQPAQPRTIRYTCLCCHRVIDIQEETYALRSCSSCDHVMVITKIDTGKVVKFGRAKVAVLARRAS